jgi:C1A family cysteine protease
MFTRTCNLEFHAVCLQRECLQLANLNEALNLIIILSMCAADLQKFITKTADGIYQLPSGTGRGQGHAVTLIGCNNTGDGYWIVKNSFGPTWGNGGFFKVGRGTSHLCIFH